MQMTFRWFGKDLDTVSLEQIKQIPGVVGVVPALHYLPAGEAWEMEDVQKMYDEITAAGLTMECIESVNVHEDIKLGLPTRDKLIENYKKSIRNLAKVGVKVICYNFMPILDWARTDLEYPNPDGTSNLYFNRAEFAYFDIHILKRENAEKDWTDSDLARVEELKSKMTPEGETRLIENIIIKTQGFVSGNFSESDYAPVEKFRSMLKLYEGIDLSLIHI